MTIVEFLKARIAEDEADARLAADVEGSWYTNEISENVNTTIYGNPVAVGPWNGDIGDAAWHIARWDPDRVLAECAAKRKIVADRVRIDRSANDDEWSMGYSDANYSAMRALAAIDANHPDFQEEWRP